MGASFLTPCRLKAPTARLNLDNERATAAFRVIQESLTNVTRHAQASYVDISLQSSRDKVLIEVRDNGRGFDSEQTRQGTLGLLGMRERGHMLGGPYAVPPGKAPVSITYPFADIPPRNHDSTDDR